MSKEENQMNDLADKVLSDYSGAVFAVPRVLALAACAVGSGTQIWLIINKGVSAVRVIGAVLLGFGFLTCAVWLALYLKGKGDFRRECSALGEGAPQQLDNAIALGDRRFAEEYLLFYGKHRPHIVKYSDILTVEQKSVYIRITYRGGRGDSAVTAGENGAIILAALKSKNDDIKFLIKGREIITGRKGR